MPNSNHRLFSADFILIFYHIFNRIFCILVVFCLLKIIQQIIKQKSHYNGQDDIIYFYMMMTIIIKTPQIWGEYFMIKKSEFTFSKMQNRCGVQIFLRAVCDFPWRGGVPHDVLGICGQILRHVESVLML